MKVILKNQDSRNKWAHRIKYRVNFQGKDITAPKNYYKLKYVIK